MAFIECRNLTREYRRGENKIRPLDGLDLDVEQGTFLALMGPSGSGKTTLLNLIAGIDKPTEGSLVIEGLDIARLSRSKLAGWRAENVGYIFQLYNLVPVLTAYENVELPLLLQSLSRKERHQRVATALEASRSPVGSSATRIAGSVTMARAVATRCSCPPESWRG